MASSISVLFPCAEGVPCSQMFPPIMPICEQQANYVNNKPNCRAQCVWCSQVKGSVNSSPKDRGIYRKSTKAEGRVTAGGTFTFLAIFLVLHVCPFRFFDMCFKEAGVKGVEVFRVIEIDKSLNVGGAVFPDLLAQDCIFCMLGCEYFECVILFVRVVV